MGVRFPVSSLLWLMVFLFVTTAATASLPVQLRGTVADENGLAVAGAEVVVRADGGATQTTYTDSAGHFVLQLPAAGSYRVSFNKRGYFRVMDYEVALHEGSNEISFTLNHEAEIHEKVEVISSTHGVEPQETSHRQTLVAHEIRDIPVPSSHDLRSTLPAIPGVLRDAAGQLHIAGARAGETEYLLDGFEIGDPATGRLTTRVNPDAVRAIDVSAGRHAASFAHAGGGVVALDTVAGDDRWRFGTTNFIPGLNFERGAHFGSWFPRLTFSGPLLRRRAWFSEAISLQHTFRLFRELPPGANTATQWAGDNLLRAQVHLTPTNVLQGSFLYNQESDAHLGLGAFSPLATTTDLDARRFFVSVKDQAWWKNTLLELGVAVDTARSDRFPQGGLPYVITPSGTAGNFFETLHRRARRWQVLGDVVLPSRHWHGTHELQMGMNGDAIAFHPSAQRNAIQIRRADGTLLQQTTFSGSGDSRVSNTRMGAYAQDSWQVTGALRLQFGVRADGDRLLHRVLAGPRLAANVLPFRDDRAKLAFGWGLYYQPVDLALYGQAFDQQRSDTFFDASGRIPVLGPVTSRFVLPPGGLRQPRFYTTSIEWVQKIGPNTQAGIHLLGRDGHLGLVYDDQQLAQPGALFLLQNHRRDRYRAVEISLRHSFSEKAHFFADYTRSRARSNEVLDTSLGALLFSAQAPGPVAWDAPHRVLSWGWTPLPFWGLSVSYFLEYRTGFPFSVLNQQQQLIGPPNRLRFPDYVSMNLGIEKRFELRGYAWAARFSAINVTDHDNSNQVINNADSPNFLRVAGGQHRALTARLRFVGRK